MKCSSLRSVTWYAGGAKRASDESYYDIWLTQNNMTTKCCVAEKIAIMLCPPLWQAQHTKIGLLLMAAVTWST